MKILGNMQLLSSCSRVLISLTNQNLGVGEANDTIMGGVQCLNSLLLHPNSDCVEFKKMEKRAKNENSRFAKNTFAFFQYYVLSTDFLALLNCKLSIVGLFWGLIRIGKIVWGRCARQKNFLTFCRQLRCEILEISSYIGAVITFDQPEMS